MLADRVSYGSSRACVLREWLVHPPEMAITACYSYAGEDAAALPCAVASAARAA